MPDTVMITVPIIKYEDLIRSEMALQAIRQIAETVTDNDWKAMLIINGILSIV